jgi:hypothetical protein
MCGCVLCVVIISRSKLRINICENAHHNYLLLAYSLEFQLNGGKRRHNHIAFYGS